MTRDRAERLGATIGTYAAVVFVAALQIFAA